MSDSFDPYHKWLGIRPEDQPPNHYRLLGVELFESDRDVIEAAANQRMAYLQDLAAGPHLEASQKLLNEIAAARRCLLNPEEKAAYDHRLRSEREAGTAERQRPAPGAAASAPVRRVWLISAAVAGLAVLIVMGYGVVGSFRGESGEPETRARLVLKWPLNQREGAVILIDGKRHPLPETERIEIELTEGPHELTLKRDGYREIRRTLTFREGEPVRLRPNWRR